MRQKFQFLGPNLGMYGTRGRGYDEASPKSITVGAFAVISES